MPTSGASHSFPSDLGEADISAFVETLGTHADGTPAYGTERLRFNGPLVLCDADSPRAAASPAMAALLALELDEERAALLKGELERVEELLDIEPECRWALLSRGRLAAAACARSLEARKAVERSVAEGYERMAELDPSRGGFYAEAAAEGTARGRVLSWLEYGSSLASPLELSSLSLRHLAPATAFAAFGVRRLDVSNNRLQVLGPILLLRSLEELRAGRNRLASDVCEAFALPRLRLLDVSDNSMVVMEAAAEPPEELGEVDISGNPPALDAGGPSGGVVHLYSLLARCPGGGADAAARGDWSVDWDAEAGRCRCFKGGNPSNKGGTADVN